MGAPQFASAKTTFLMHGLPPRRRSSTCPHFVRRKAESILPPAWHCAHICICSLSPLAVTCPVGSVVTHSHPLLVFSIAKMVPFSPGFPFEFMCDSLTSMAPTGKLASLALMAALAVGLAYVVTNIPPWA